MKEPDLKKMNKKIYLKVDTDITIICQVLSWFEQINSPPISNKKIWWECQTLIIEGFTNIVEHGHKNLPFETPIELEAKRLDTCIEIRIWSLGLSFNLEEKLQKISRFEENTEERGRGLKIISELADKLRYEYMSDHRYCLFISKFY